MHSHCCRANQYDYPAPYYVPVCCWCGLPPHACICGSYRRPAYYQVQQEISVDPEAAEKSVLIGGVTPVRITLEYLPVEGAATPSVKVTITNPGATATTIDEGSIAAGYHVKDDLPPLEPGAIVKLTTTECLARLRWLETFTY